MAVDQDTPTRIAYRDDNLQVDIPIHLLSYINQSVTSIIKDVGMSACKLSSLNNPFYGKYHSPSINVLGAWGTNTLISQRRGVFPALLICIPHGCPSPGCP